MKSNPSIITQSLPLCGYKDGQFLKSHVGSGSRAIAVAVTTAGPSSISSDPTLLEIIESVPSVVPVKASVALLIVSVLRIGFSVIPPVLMTGVGVFVITTVLLLVAPTVFLFFLSLVFFLFLSLVLAFFNTRFLTLSPLLIVAEAAVAVDVVAAVALPRIPRLFVARLTTSTSAASTTEEDNDNDDSANTARRACLITMIAMV